MFKLHTVIVSTRQGRRGPPVAEWFHEMAKAHGKFDATLIDLASFNLPVLDEPHHPMRRQYTQEHTKKWSASVNAADAFVFVTPEYNYSPPPSLTNALDFLYWEWQYKPVGLVSYGGVSGGVRAAQAVKLTLTALKMMPIPEGVAIPNFEQQLQDGKFAANDLNRQGATAVLNELLRWTEALASLREGIRKPQ
ncbi:MAG TPA: NAD(P)H-dependent oxidoreductase [Rhizomicrobium sp.]|nr:NAD(P)H-dependent oxidoreductase [Rhizomicrobium sp.]